MFAFDLTVTVPVLLSIGSIVFAWFRTRRIAVDGRFQEADARFKTGSDRMDRHESRIQSLEQTVKAMPDRQDLHKIELALERVSGTMGRMEAVMEGNQQIMARLELIVSRHEDHLLGANR